MYIAQVGMIDPSCRYISLHIYVSYIRSPNFKHVPIYVSIHNYVCYTHIGTVGKGIDIRHYRQLPTSRIYRTAYLCFIVRTSTRSLHRL